PPLVLYYLPGAVGWTATVAGRPTAPWVLPNPLILTGSRQFFGVQTNGASSFGFRVSWAMNLSVVVEACTNLSAPSWTPLQTNALAPSSWFQFTNPGWTNYPNRFYRVRQQ